ncbi:MAG: 1-acyl-sn-glycerol-3-phosphate acyltransferase [Myxococcales bacterium]|nr:1-acyl-sn-glycerol-3-phosphate acyltransferase [Myxococcales bacterium]
MFASRNARIFQFMDEREPIIREVESRVVAEIVDRAASHRDDSLEYVLNEAAFLEMKRLAKGSSKMDLRPYGYWQDIARTIGKADESHKVRILRELAGVYARDVAGKFTPGVYKFATRVLPVGLSALLNAQSVESVLGKYRSLSERIIIEGATAHLRQLAEIGTLVVVPTHTSNLDSIAVGWGLDESGLPPVTYGAGKNLFSNPLTSFFMHNLGAYKVDRRIRHGIYKQVLKCYSEVLLERGYHSLFFPGGTRCRSNEVETHLKLGLMGTALKAYTNNLMNNRPKPKVFICPLTINYHLVLEGETLIGEHLRTDGGKRYIIEDDEFADLSKIYQFASKTMGMEYTIYLRFGEPMDPFGNPVDIAGISRDPHERPIDIERYLWTDGEVQPDAARDRAYTVECGHAVARSFKRNTVAVSSSFLAAVLFAALKDAYPHLDLYRLLRVVKGELVPNEAVFGRAERLQARLRKLARARKICLGHDVEGLGTADLIERGGEVLSMYHTPPVIRRVSNGFEIGNPELLLFYANRLANYGLESVLHEDAIADGGEA